VVDLVMDDLSGPAGEGLDPGLKLLVLPLHLDALIPLLLGQKGFPVKWDRVRYL
jgi:hypothetical protein